MSRIGVWIAIAACWGAGIVLGTTGAALSTDAGRRIITRHAITLANRALTGSLTVKEVGGSLLDGLDARGVTIRGEDGAVLATIERLRLRYRLRDLLSGRVVLGQLLLDRPVVSLTKLRSGERFNFEQIFGLGESADETDEARDGRSGPLIAFRDVEITDGTVIIRTPTDARGSGSIEREDGPHGALRVRRIEQLTARFNYVRLSSARPDQEALLFEVRRLSAQVSDPRIAVSDLRGRVEIEGDSLMMDLSVARLGKTEADVEGSLAWGTDTLLVNLRADADQVVSDELRGLVPDIPAGLVGRGDFTIQAISGDVLKWSADRLDLRGRPDGGQARGRLGMVLGPDDHWEFRNTELELDNFDLEYFRGFLDTLPIAGRVTGRVGATGLREFLQLDLDVQFRDSLVEGWPESFIRGLGHVSLGVPGEFVFQRFELEDADISLATVRRLVPAIQLVGRVRAAGMLDGPWLETSFDGVLRYADPPLPETTARGVVRLDGRGDTLGVWANVELDSLKLAGFRSSYAAMDVRGALAGRLTVSGYLDSLEIDTELSGPMGHVVARGALLFLSEHSGAHGLNLNARGFDLDELNPALPATGLNVDVVLKGFSMAGAAPRWWAVLALDSSVVEGVSLDSALAIVTLADSVLTADTVRVWGPALELDAGGELGVRAPYNGVLTVAAVADSIGTLEPLFASWLGPPGSGVVASPSGSVAVAVQIEGALDAYELSASVEAELARRGEVFVSRGQVHADWSYPTRALRFDADVDSVHIGAFAFGGIEASARGGPDSIAWRGFSRFGEDGIWIGGGRVTKDSAAYRIAVDSLGARLASSSWFVDRSAVVVATDSGIDFRNVIATSDRTAGRVTVSGRLPFAGPGMLAASFEAVPVQDLWLLLQKRYQDKAGDVSGTLRLDGHARSPTLELSIALNNGVFGAFRAPYVEGVLDYRGRRLIGDVRLWRGGERILEINMELPVDLALTDVEHRRLPGALEVRAVADSVDLAVLDAITPATRRTSGTLDADFGITGTWELPTLTGQLEIRDGATTLPALGIRNQDLNGRFVLSGDTIRIDRLSVTSGPGSAEFRGYVRLAELSRPILRLHINASDFRAIDIRGFLTLNATADLDIAGPLYGATITGRGTATGGVLYFADLITKDIVNLEDTLFAGIVDTARIRRQGLGAAFESRFLDSLRIDSLQLEMGSDVWLRSGEANIQLSGVVNVDKLRDRYRLNGTLQAPVGTYRLELGIGELITKEFTVTRGEVRYFGTPDLNADLDVDARRVVRTTRGENIAVLVNIGGTLYEPRLTLSSDAQPPLSEAEIISYLMFGGPSVEAFAGTGGYVNRLLAQEALSVISGQIEYSLISELGLPLDYFQIRPAVTAGRGLAGTEIGLGKQFTVLGRTAFLTASPRICPQQELSRSIGGASLEFRLSGEWLLSASADPTQSCEGWGRESDLKVKFGFDLFWEKSF